MALGLNGRGRSMARLVFVLLIVAISGCAQAPGTRNNYAGQDAGQVVVGIGAARNPVYSSYALTFRKKGALDGPQGRFTYVPRDPVTGTERETVVVASLPAGQYEIFDFAVLLNSGAAQKTFSSTQPFSIPFAVRPGETVYLGNYQAIGIFNDDIPGTAAGVVFVVQNRQSRDLELAKDLKRFSVIHNATPDPRALANPDFMPDKPGP